MNGEVALYFNRKVGGANRSKLCSHAALVKNVQASWPLGFHFPSAFDGRQSTIYDDGDVDEDDNGLTPLLVEPSLFF